MGIVCWDSWRDFYCFFLIPLQKIYFIFYFLFWKSCIVNVKCTGFCEVRIPCNFDSSSLAVSWHTNAVLRSLVHIRHYTPISNLFPHSNFSRRQSPQFIQYGLSTETPRIHYNAWYHRSNTSTRSLHSLPSRCSSSSNNFSQHPFVQSPN